MGKDVAEFETMVLDEDVNVRDMSIFQGMGGVLDHSTNGCTVISLMIAIAALGWIDTTETTADIIQKRCGFFLRDIRELRYADQGHCAIDEDDAYDAMKTLGDKVQVKFCISFHLNIVFILIKLALRLLSATVVYVSRLLTAILSHLVLAYGNLRPNFQVAMKVVPVVLFS